MSIRETEQPAIRQRRSSLSPQNLEQLKWKLQPLYDETSATAICLALALLMEEDANLAGAVNLRHFILPM